MSRALECTPAAVLFCGAWDEGPGYPRATALRRGLESVGFAVHECRLPGRGRDKQRAVKRAWSWPGLLWGELRRRASLRTRLRAELRARRLNAIVVPYPGHLVVDAIAREADVPVVLDLFLSAYDTAVEDRRLFAPGSLPARLLRWIDRRACEAADLVLLDTEENAAHVARLTGLPHARFAVVPVADPDAAPQVTPWQQPAGGPLRLLFFGTGVPLHGLPVLLDAMQRVRGIELTLVGGTAEERQRAVSLGQRVVLGPEFVPRQELQRLLEDCHLVAGVFGGTAKAQRVVPFKVVHALAAGRPVVTADTPALRRWLADGDGAFLVPAGDPAALARRLADLVATPAALAAAAAAARPIYDRCFAVQRTGERLHRLLNGLASTREER